MAIRGKEKVAVGDDAAMEAVGKIASIFNFWDRDQDGFWSADEANASQVDDSEIAQQDWATLCEWLKADPEAGLQLHHVCRMYLSFGVEKIDADYKSVRTCETSINTEEAAEELLAATLASTKRGRSSLLRVMTAAPEKYSIDEAVRAVEKIENIFNHWDRDRDEAWCYDEARRVQKDTENTRLEPRDWLAVCGWAGADPEHGLSRHNVVKLYLAAGRKKIDADHATAGGAAGGSKRACEGQTGRPVEIPQVTIDGPPGSLTKLVEAVFSFWDADGDGVWSFEEAAKAQQDTEPGSPALTKEGWGMSCACVGADAAVGITFEHLAKMYQASPDGLAKAQADCDKANELRPRQPPAGQEQPTQPKPDTTADQPVPPVSLPPANRAICEIFEYWDADGDGFWSFAEARRAQLDTDASELTRDSWIDACRRLKAHEERGLTLPNLTEMYSLTGEGDRKVNADLAVARSLKAKRGRSAQDRGAAGVEVIQACARAFLAAKRAADRAKIAVDAVGADVQRLLARRAQIDKEKLGITTALRSLYVALAQAAGPRDKQRACLQQQQGLQDAVSAGSHPRVSFAGTQAVDSSGARPNPSSAPAFSNPASSPPRARVPETTSTAPRGYSPYGTSPASKDLSPRVADWRTHFYRASTPTPAQTSQFASTHRSAATPSLRLPSGQSLGTPSFGRNRNSLHGTHEAGRHNYSTRSTSADGGAAFVGRTYSQGGLARSHAAIASAYAKVAAADALSDHIVSKGLSSAALKSPSSSARRTVSPAYRDPSSLRATSTPDLLADSPRDFDTSTSHASPVGTYSALLSNPSPRVYRAPDPSPTYASSKEAYRHSPASMKDLRRKLLARHTST
ncbi:hypothetical protein DIPPA_16314 [Diplonema papillatum]|nr:hypothetical protein DIPPA_16314 [Diplonema papillatum]|eukprot:gene18993-29257_t